ncbi:MAG: alpha/beta fold hydrolase [Actinomycetota bacterium]|nr:alpha/beta fold hydrolase [Actinomycetota bacterium]
MMRNRAGRSALILALAMTVALGACSGGDDDDRVAADDQEQSAADEPTDDASAVTEATTAVPAYDGYTSEVYGAADKWICRPDLASDVCRENLDVTSVAADGTTTVTESFAADTPIDCFYVYPTLNFGDEGNTTFDAPATGLEIGSAHAQAAAFSSVCRVFAPRYRQLTLGGFATGDRELAYGDVADAFKHYMANDNEGRGVVLIGHSQGSGHLAALLAEEFDDDSAMRERLVSALLIGSGVEVPQGEDVGGTFENIPACREASQTACVITYASFRATAPPPENSFFGRPREGEGQALCTNPAALAGGAADLDLQFPAASAAYAPGSEGAPIDTGFITMPGLLSGECVERDGFTYLEITVNADPADPRTDTIGGDLTPEWGLHAVDISLALGDLVEVVRTQSEAFAG